MKQFSVSVSQDPEGIIGIRYNWEYGVYEKYKPPFRVYNWLFRGFVGDEILPSYMGILSLTTKGSRLNNQDSMESKRVFFVTHLQKMLRDLFVVWVVGVTGGFSESQQFQTRKSQTKAATTAETE